jgi:hypothetical protein
MSGNFQHKITNFEIAPPAEVWNKITDQLDKEYNIGDIRTSQKLYNYEIDPPSSILDKVLSGINTEPTTKRAAKILTLPVRRIAAAAVMIGLIAVTLVYLLRPESSLTKKNSTANVASALQNTTLIPLSVSDRTRNIQPNLIPPGFMSLSAIANNKPEYLYSNDRNSQNQGNIKYASLNPILAANELSRISVTAPPIYDVDGNIIMDENLVSSPDDNYIIVTSPNGKQTKISRKFLKMLSVLNGGSANNYMDAENSQWKIRFEEWRNKLLQNASYIPTANNFLDIMDLKNMLQEN